MLPETIGNHEIHESHEKSKNDALVFHFGVVPEVHQKAEFKMMVIGAFPFVCLVCFVVKITGAGTRPEKPPGRSGLF
jgi:hypothetical protein